MTAADRDRRGPRLPLLRRARPARLRRRHREPRGRGRRRRGHRRRRGSRSSTAASYVVVQKYLHDLAGWDALTAEQQENAIGRSKLSNIEMDDAVKPPDAHIALNVIEDADGVQQSGGPLQHAVRRAVGTREFGTYFIGYASSPRGARTDALQHVPRHRRTRRTTGSSISRRRSPGRCSTSRPSTGSRTRRHPGRAAPRRPTRRPPRRPRPRAGTRSGWGRCASRTDVGPRHGQPTDVVPQPSLTTLPDCPAAVALVWTRYE